MIIIANGYCFFNKRKIGSVLKFQRYLGVKPNSYAGTIARRLYFQYFGDSKNLLRYYKKYYKKEFPSCAEFVVCRLMVEYELIKSISNKNLSFASFNSKRDNIKYSLDFDETMIDIFCTYVGGVKHEDSNRICY